MGNFTFRPAVRENVGLLIGLAGASGSGKTFSAMELATGIAGAKPFALIDTENRRALHYADRFRFDHGSLEPPFRPDAYAAAIAAADSAGYPVIVVDSMSHVHAGEGGTLDWHEEELDRMAGQDWKKRESCKMAAWIQPKTSHKRMVQSLLRTKAHLILCLRAEEKIEIVKGADGRIVVQPKVSRVGIEGWVPVCDKTLPFELTASFLLLPERPGYPRPIKLQEQHKALFPLDKALMRDSGAAIARWAAGGQKPAEKPTDWPAEINAAESVETLAEVWTRIPAAMRKALAGLKDKRKAALSTPPPEQKEDPEDDIPLPPEEPA